jgi:hypothetical protein
VPSAAAKPCFLGLAATLLAAWPADAAGACRILCEPTLKLEPTFTFTNPFGGPRLQRLSDGAIVREEGEAVFELILATEVPTQWERLALVAEVIWPPFVRDNAVELELEANFKWLLSEQTGGWVSSHVDVVDKFSSAERPDDRNAYTHKLNFELDTAVRPFNRLPDGHWLRGIEVELSLDYVATGLARAGDEAGPGFVYLDAASPWSISIVLVVPLAPL